MTLLKVAVGLWVITELAAIAFYVWLLWAVWNDDKA